MTRWTRFLAVLAILAMVAAACSDDGEPGSDGETGGATGETTGETTGGELPGAGVVACEVTDTGGIDDKSFNATAFAGLEQAAAELGVEPNVLESQTQDDYGPNIQTFIDQGCDLVVTVGFLLGDATLAAAQDNPDQKFAIVDVDFFDSEAGEDITLDNVKELTFATDQAAFLAGYLAAGMTESGIVGTFGGINIPPVTIFMNGFAAGIGKYNEDNDTDVQLLGWDTAAQDGTFTGDFENQDNGRRVTEDFISEGADIILPVAGPVGLGAAAAAQDAGNVQMIWVDTDGCVSAAEYCPLFLTSIMKNMNIAVFDSIASVVNGDFTGGLYSGTLENGGVGLAEYHEFDSAVPQELKDAITELQAGVIDGSVSVDPADYA
ncbi:MAG: BMP family lipoprotein [Actinomycetota bacterium]